MPPKRSKIASRPRQVIDQHHGARAIGSGIETERRALPEHAQIAGILGVERAVAVAQAADEGAAGFLAQNVAVRLPPLAHRFLDDHGEPARDAAEKVMSGIDQFVRRELVARRRLRRQRRSRRDRGRRCGGGGVAPAGRRRARLAKPEKSKAATVSPTAKFIDISPLNPLLTRSV